VFAKIPSASRQWMAALIAALPHSSIDLLIFIVIHDMDNVASTRKDGAKRKLCLVEEKVRLLTFFWQKIWLKKFEFLCQLKIWDTFHSL
jgi:uncharacterized membrane protein (UPF0182 family)